ncbi:MAG: hypothetical protein QNK37_27420 [Acidobacteriota bacterium]|nr:hypothetical protein [Acidobacteriota bacterium]
MPDTLSVRITSSLITDYRYLVRGRTAVFSNLFTPKIEKDLKALAAKGPELELRYTGGESISVSKILKIYRNTIQIIGFFGKLKQKDLEITMLATGISFQTQVTRVGNDQLGNPVFFCSMPERIKPRPKPLQKYRINMKGKAKLLVTTKQGERSVVLPVYEISELGITLANDSKIGIKIGTKFFQGMVTIGEGQSHLCDMQVANVRPVKKDTPELLVCAFSREPRAIGEMLSVAKGLAPKPKPPTKK